MLGGEERSTVTLTEGRVVSKQEVRIGERSITSKKSFIALFFEYPIRKSLEDIAIVFLTKTIRLIRSRLLAYAMYPRCFPDAKLHHIFLEMYLRHVGRDGCVNVDLTTYYIGPE